MLVLQEMYTELLPCVQSPVIRSCLLSPHWTDSLGNMSWTHSATLGRGWWFEKWWESTLSLYQIRISFQNSLFKYEYRPKPQDSRQSLMHRSKGLSYQKASRAHNKGEQLDRFVHSNDVTVSIETVLGAQDRSGDIGLSATLELRSKQSNQLAQMESSNYTQNLQKRKRQAQEKNVLEKQSDIYKFSWALVGRKTEWESTCLSSGCRLTSNSRKKNQSRLESLSCSISSDTKEKNPSV